MGFFKDINISRLVKTVSAGLTQLSKDASVSEAEIYKKATGKNKPTGKAAQTPKKNTAKKSAPTGLMRRK